MPGFPVSLFGIGKKKTSVFWRYISPKFFLLLSSDAWKLVIGIFEDNCWNCPKWSKIHKNYSHRNPVNRSFLILLVTLIHQNSCNWHFSHVAQQHGHHFTGSYNMGRICVCDCQEIDAIYVQDLLTNLNWVANCQANGFDCKSLVLD